MTSPDTQYGNLDAALETREMFGAEQYTAFLHAALEQINIDLAFLNARPIDWTSPTNWKQLHRAIGTSGVIGAERLSQFLMRLEQQKTSDGAKPSDDEVAMLRDLVSGTERFFRQVSAGALG